MPLNLFEQNSTAELILLFIFGAFLVFYVVYAFFAIFHAFRFGFHGDKWTWPGVILFVIGSALLIVGTIVGFKNS